MVARAQIRDRLAAWRSDPLTFMEDVLTLADGRSYGHALDDWQRQDFEAAFADPERSVWWERPRGHSKTMDAAAFALHHQLCGSGRRIYFGAVDRDQAALAHDSASGFIHRSDLLRDALKIDRWRVSAPSTDSTLQVLAADAASSWGLRPSLIIVDELQAWRGEAAEELFWSLFSSLGKVPGARMLVATTAGWDRTSLCWKMREQVADDPAWTFSRRGQCASWINPAFLKQQKRLLPEHVYRRLHANEWTESGGEYLTYNEVEGIFDASLRPLRECHQGAHFIGLDVGLSGDATAVAVVHRGDDGVGVHQIAAWQGTREAKVQLGAVEEWIADAAQHFSSAVLHADPWQAVGTVQRLRARGIKCQDVSFSAQYRGRLFQNLLELVRTDSLRCFPHERLKDELLRLEFREVGGNLRVDHPPGGHDDHVVAVALAALGAVSERPKRRIVAY